MGRRKAKFHTDGVLVVNKPAGPTSHDVVAMVRRRFSPAKLGHAGTLDPFSDGVLVLAFNRATRLAELLGAGSKTYRAGLILGAATSTGDHTGEVSEDAPVPELTRQAAEAAVQGLVGERMQAPPAYSAVKHQGRPLYSYARKGVVIEKPARPITVHQARLLGLDGGRLEFEVTCSRGTYVRTLGEELARDLGTMGHLGSLTRTASEPFLLEAAFELDQVLDWSPEELAESFMAPAQALTACGLPAAVLDDELAWQLRQGRILEAGIFAPGVSPRVGGAFMALNKDGELIAVLRWLEPEQARPDRSYESLRVFPETNGGGADDNTYPQALQAE